MKYIILALVAFSSVHAASQEDNSERTRRVSVASTISTTSQRTDINMSIYEDLSEWRTLRRTKKKDTSILAYRIRN